MITSLDALTPIQKEELVASLATLLVGSSSTDAISAELLQAVATASGNTLSPALATLYSSVASKCPGGVKTYLAPPGGGGGGGGGSGGAGADAGGAAAAAAPVEEEKEEEMEAPAVDMFGSGGGGGDY